MYNIPEEMRKAYEALAIPVLFMGINDEGIVVPVIISDGFLKLHDIERNMIDGYFSGDISGTILKRVHPDEVDKLYLISDDFMFNHTDYDITFRFRKEDGYHLLHSVGYWQTMPDGQQLAVIIYSDVQNYENTIYTLAEKYKLFQKDDFYTDSVTNLPNTNYLVKYGDDRIHAIISKGFDPIIYFFDIDSMQSYNSKYGSKKGDELLELVGMIIADEFEHALVVRVSDDHYVVIDKCIKEDISSIIDKINDRIKAEAYGITTGLYAGIYIGNSNTKASDAVDHCKRALKLLKRSANNRYRIYTEEDDTLYTHQRYIVENFYKAINNGYIKVYYQSFMSVETGNGTGFEALARWIDPEEGMICPDDFIPVLEKYHLLYELDLYIFEQVCREVKLRYNAGLPLLPVSVNFSRQDFEYIDLITELNRIIDKYDIEQYGIDNSYFIIEITEQSLASASDKFYEQLEAIRANGYKLWIDDFGSGYSSINMFCNLDVDLIKIDMDILKNLDKHHGTNRVILKAIVSAAHELGVGTLCEGMETNEQKLFLRDIGCELAQGYLYHKPESLDIIFARLNIDVSIPAWETTEERLSREKMWIEKNKKDGMY